MSNRDEFAPIVWHDFQGECFLKGHDCDFDDAFRCRRCGEHLSYEEIGWPGIAGWLRWARWKFTSDLRCHNCKLWLGKHTQQCLDDLPF